MVFLILSARVALVPHWWQGTHNALPSVSPALIPTDRYWESNTNQSFPPATELACLEFMSYLHVLSYDRDLLIRSVPICATCPRTSTDTTSYIAAITNRQEARLLQRSTHSGLLGKKTALVRSLTAVLGSVIDPGLSLFLTHFPKVSSSLAVNVTS